MPGFGRITSLGCLKTGMPMSLAQDLSNRIDPYTGCEKG
jgi:hypothetical protein